MKKTILIAFLFLLAIAPFVSSYSSYYVGDNYGYYYTPAQSAYSVYVSGDYRDCIECRYRNVAHHPAFYSNNYPYRYYSPHYRSYSYQSPYGRCNEKKSGWIDEIDLNDCEKYFALRYITDSYDSRYQIARGKTSGELFLPGNQDDVPNTNWRYKEAYDRRDQKPKYGGSYYYEPKYDSNTGHYNWKF